MSTPTPTIGRIVLYRGKDGVARPAIVTHVHSQFCINLFAFPAGTPEEEAYEGIPGLRTSVTHAQPDQEPGCFPSWHWMPYQLQAAGTRHVETPARPNEVEDSHFNHGLSFGAAIQALKNGRKVARAGWNGKGMWLVLQVPDAHSKMTLPYIYIEHPVGHPAYHNGSRVPWLASQTDALAEDWVVLTN